MDLYRQMPILYDREHPDFRYINRKEKAWKELSKRTEMSVENCKKRVTYIRARFTLERRNTKKSDWPLMDKLKFLHRHIQVRRFRSTHDDADGGDDDVVENNSSSTSLYNVSLRPRRNGVSERASDGDDDNVVMPPKRRRLSADDFESHFTNDGTSQQQVYMTSDMIGGGGGGFVKQRDEHTIFGEYVAEVLRKLPPDVQPQTTLRIMKVLVESQDAVLATEQRDDSHTS